MTAVQVRVGEISEQIRGVTYGKGDASDTAQDGYLPVLRAGNITDSGAVFDDLVYVPAGQVSPKQLLRSGDVLIAASSGSLDVVGKAAPILSDYQGAFGAFCKVLRPNQSLVHPSFFAHFFKTVEYRRIVSSLAAGANINNLRNEHLDDLLIPLPPLPEQRRIAAILDKVEALRSKRRAALAQLDRLAQSIFVEMFGDPVTNPKGWPSARFASLCSRVTVGIVVQPASYYQDSGVPALRSLNVKPGKIVLSDLVYFSEQDNNTKLKKTKLRAGDLVLVRSGQPGTTAIIPQELDGINAIDILIASPETDKANPTYLCEFFNSNAGRSLVLSSQRGQIQKHLNVSSLNAAPIMLPPLGLQRQFDDRIAAVKALSVQSNLALDELNCLFASLQHRAFRGEL